MTLESIEKIPTKEKENNIEELREDIRKMRNEAKKIHEEEIASNTTVKNHFDRHLLKLTNEDINNIPVAHLECWDKLNKMKYVDLEDGYEELSNEINNLFNKGEPDGMRSILAHKLVELVNSKSAAEKAA